MNKENASKLWKMIQEAGDYLQSKLPDHPNHPKGRNAYAHVALCVKKKFSNDIETKIHIESFQKIKKLFKKKYPKLNIELNIISLNKKVEIYK